jgi:hypothetical protein
MRRMAMLVAAGALVAAVPALAAKPPHPTHPTHPTHPSHPAGGKGSCKVQDKGYYARGTFVSSMLTPGTGNHRFNGPLTVNVTRANHKAPTGSQTYTLTNARVRFGKGVNPTMPATTDRVILHGTITELPHGCSTTGFTSTITVKNVFIKVAQHG